MGVHLHSSGEHGMIAIVYSIHSTIGKLNDNNMAVTKFAMWAVLRNSYKAIN